MVQASGRCCGRLSSRSGCFCNSYGQLQVRWGQLSGRLTSRSIAEIQQGAPGDHTDAKVLRSGGFSYTFLGAIFSP